MWLQDMVVFLMWEQSIVLVLTLVTFLSEIISGAMWVKLAIVLLQGTGPSPAFAATSKSITCQMPNRTVSVKRIQITRSQHCTIAQLGSATRWTLQSPTLLPRENQYPMLPMSV